MEVRGQFHSPAALFPREINVSIYLYRAMRYNSFYKIVNLHILIHILYVHDVCVCMYHVYHVCVFVCASCCCYAGKNVAMLVGWVP